MNSITLAVREPHFIQRFNRRITKTPYCWEIKLSQTKQGYKRIKVKYDGEWHSELAHRCAWMMEYGDIPVATPFVLHRCDNTGCVNYNHFFLGTHQDNCDDKMEKGRFVVSNSVGYSGELNINAKFTEQDIKMIRALYASGEYYQYELAAMFHTAKSAIGSIVRRETWKYIT